MSTLALHLFSARAPTISDTPTSVASAAAVGSHSLAAPLVLVIILVAIIGIIAISAVFRSASVAISVITQPTMAVFRLLVAALVVIVLLVAVLVSQPADANNRQPSPVPTSTMPAHPPR